MNNILPNERIIEKIILLRGEKVMLDRDLAVLYWVETRILTRAVRRNIDRFPKDFMFEISKEEYISLRSYFGILENKGRWKHSKYNSLAFTEHGILMLSSVLRSKKAVDINVQIMRMFIAMRKMIQNNALLLEKIESLEAKFSDYDEQLQEIWFAIKQLLREEEISSWSIGFQAG